MVEEPDYVKIALRQIGSQAAKWGLGAAAAGALTGLAASAGARRHAAGAREELAELNKNRPGRSSSPRDKRVHDFIRRAAEIDVANAERARAHPKRDMVERALGGALSLGALGALAGGASAVYRRR